MAKYYNQGLGIVDTSSVTTSSGDELAKAANYTLPAYTEYADYTWENKPISDRVDALVSQANAPIISSPSITITTPSGSIHYIYDSTNQVTIIGTASEPSDADYSLAYAVTGVTTGSGSITKGADWSFLTPYLNFGNSIVRATITSARGPTNYDTVTISRTPTLPPVITITTPTAAPTASTIYDNVDVGGTASDPNSLTIDSIDYSVDGTPGVATGVSAWSFNAPLIVGNNTIGVSGTNNWNLTGSDSIIVTRLATQNPIVTITTETTGSSAFSFFVEGTASDPNGLTITDVNYQTTAFLPGSTVQYFDNTKWQNAGDTGTFIWDGTKWTVSSGGVNHSMEPIGAWSTGFRPWSVILNGGPFVDSVTIKDTNGGTIGTAAPGYISGEEIDLTFGDYDIGKLTCDNVDSNMVITNIRFVDSETTIVDSGIATGTTDWSFTTEITSAGRDSENTITVTAVDNYTPPLSGSDSIIVTYSPPAEGGANDLYIVPDEKISPAVWATYGGCSTFQCINNGIIEGSPNESTWVGVLDDYIRMGFENPSFSGTCTQIKVRTHVRNQFGSDGVEITLYSDGSTPDGTDSWSPGGSYATRVSTFSVAKTAEQLTNLQVRFDSYSGANDDEVAEIEVEIVL
jgi:hypothetical protein